MKRKFNTELWIYLLLLALSFSIYSYYYHHLLMNLNLVLFKAEGDSLKNYYTFVFHIKNDRDLLNFSGLNYPFGEHIVYTDCQPLLTFLLKALPFTHNHLIGIMHGLILLSFVISPLALYRILTLLTINRLTAFLSALAIAVLSPQIHRLGGHFALAYGCIIPFGILLLLVYFKNQRNKTVIALFVYNTLLFFVHPYFGLGLSAFTFLSICITKIFNARWFGELKNLIAVFATGVLPILVFKIFMLCTDKHINRPDEPYGVDIMGAAANAESVFTPSFGPFVHVLKSFIKAEHVEWEALCYIGIFSFAGLITAIIGFPFYFKKFSVRKELAGMFITAVLFLFFSFGAHIKILGFLHIEIATLNQFRAFGRFAWYFYFLLPVFLMSGLTNLLRMYQVKREKIIVAITAFLFFSFNMLEANYLLRYMTDDTFKARNIFNAAQLTGTEKINVSKFKAQNLQAILPLPVFHIGSEVYQRNGDASIAPAMIYSYHTGLPILSVMLSRTSLNETETALEILNRYKKTGKLIH